MQPLAQELTKFCCTMVFDKLKSGKIKQPVIEELLNSLKIEGLDFNERLFNGFNEGV